MLNCNDITALEARGIVRHISWDDLVDSKIKQCNRQIRNMAEHGHHKAEVDIWSNEEYVWNKVVLHFEERGFKVSRKWSGIVIEW